MPTIGVLEEHGQVSLLDLASVDILAGGATPLEQLWSDLRLTTTASTAKYSVASAVPPLKQVEFGYLLLYFLIGGDARLIDISLMLAELVKEVHIRFHGRTVDVLVTC